MPVSQSVLFFLISVYVFIVFCQAIQSPGAIERGLSNVTSVDHRITVALNLLSWLCDGQKRNMQNILREQKLFAVSSLVVQACMCYDSVSTSLLALWAKCPFFFME